MLPKNAIEIGLPNYQIYRPDITAMRPKLQKNELKKTFDILARRYLDSAGLIQFIISRKLIENLLPAGPLFQNDFFKSVFLNPNFDPNRFFVFFTTTNMVI